MTIYKSLTKRNSFFPTQCLLLLFGGFILIISTLCPQAIAAQTTVDKNWVGTFMFFDTAKAPKRRNSYDNVPATSYDITIEEASGKLLATLNENGVQVYQVYECSVKTKNDKIEFYYERFAADGVKDLRKFKRGDLLFSLVETPVDKQTKYMFQPAAYKILRYEKSRQNQPVYFIKQ